jgi:NAD(P)-dependent dehydrogenase (short-subunit alcohol dehydrogenase family)
MARAPQSLQDELARNVAFPKRLGRAEEFASLVEGILKTSFLNGQTIRLDGALSTPLTSM